MTSFINEKKVTLSLIVIIIFALAAFAKYWDNPISIFNREGFPITLDYFKTEVLFWKLEGRPPVEESIQGVFQINSDYYNHLLSKCKTSSLDKKIK